MSATWGDMGMIWVCQRTEKDRMGFDKGHKKAHPRAKPYKATGISPKKPPNSRMGRKLSIINYSTLRPVAS